MIDSMTRFSVASSENSEGVAFGAVGSPRHINRFSFEIVAAPHGLCFSKVQRHWTGRGRKCNRMFASIYCPVDKLFIGSK